ncbi:head-tail connector protein [Lactimicrobium massiliense]|jgi:uncharacterized phage protein (predicted DNA packaging)|uniref:head-tail connector protein n=1 Tax=Lactimicrobium massiliense TaxID=2161814 RepID=UPI001AE38216|nr:head-tail connector protein [Lactimicrobium massiliense]
MLKLDEVKQYLRVDTSDEDDLINSLMKTAVSLVRDVSRKDKIDDTNSVVKTAEMYAVAYLYEHREEADHTDLMLTLRSLLFGVREAKF